MVVIGRDRHDLGVRHRNLRIGRSELQMLLVFLGAVMARAKVRIRGSSPWSALSLRGVFVWSGSS